ncbi:MAG: anion permease [Deltaproteobacteria bacterium]|nr:anion permease [Deltaproteobacteria bacterium]
MILAGVLTALAVAAWASGRVPEHLVALYFFAAAILLQVAPPAVVLSGFTSGALWLIFGGQLMGAAIKHTGLAERLAGGALRTLGGESYGRVVAGMVALGTGLSFVMPSAMGRVVLLVPIAAAVAERCGLGARDRGRTGILLAAAFGTTVPAFSILPSNVPNAVLLGGAEALGVTIGYLEYLALHFPVLGLLRALLLAALLPRLFPAAIAGGNGAGKAAAPWSRREVAVSALVGLALLLWATDALHGIPAAWVSLAVGLLVLVPQAGLVPPRAFQEQVSYASLFFVAGVIGVGAVLGHSGAAVALGRALGGALPFAPGSPALNFASLAALGAALALFTTAPGLPAVMTAMAGWLSGVTGLPAKTVLMAETLGYGNNLLPYQSPPLVVAAQLGGLPVGATSRVSVLLFGLTAAVVLPLDYLWWRMLGWL